ncbi:MAG: DUF3885 domain-containing protein [Cellulosilyticum sp.]|nr:DUF3885 domain-containing protein [Cellulosilyticum sp.]
MRNLSEDFLSAVNSIGMSKFRHPIFYSAPVGIRFEIGTDESVYLKKNEDEDIINPKYVLKALKRAKSIYKNLPKKPNLLRIDAYPDEAFTEEKIALSICREASLPKPDEIKMIPFQWEEDDEMITQLQLYWDLDHFDFEPSVLLEQIIKADIGGSRTFASSVFFVDTYDMILYHVYDDRGADLVARDKESLYPIFKKFNNWILDNDREKINRIFAK